VAAREPASTTTMHKVHTDVAVLQAHMGHIDEKIQQIRDEVKLIENKIEEIHRSILVSIKEVADDNTASHKELTNKISGLEKWKWMVMGGCTAIGALGFELISKFF